MAVYQDTVLDIRAQQWAPAEEDLPSALDIADPRVHDALCCSLVPLVSAGALAGVPARTNMRMA